jgi:hypothetical protein
MGWGGDWRGGKGDVQKTNYYDYYLDVAMCVCVCVCSMH